MHLLLSQLLLHFCCWVCKIKVLQIGRSAEGSWNILGDNSGKKTPNTSIFWFGVSARYGTKLLFLHIFSPLHPAPATPPEKAKGHKAVSYQETWESGVGGKFLKEEAEIPEFFQKIRQTSWTHTIKSLKLIRMEISRSSAEYSLVPHKRTKKWILLLSFGSARSICLYMNWGFRFSQIAVCRLARRVNGNKDGSHPDKHKHHVLSWVSPTAVRTVHVRSPDWLSHLGWDKPTLQTLTLKHNTEDFPALNGCRFYPPGA